VIPSFVRSEIVEETTRSLVVWDLFPFRYEANEKSIVLFAFFLSYFVFFEQGRISLTGERKFLTILFLFAQTVRLCPWFFLFSFLRQAWFFLQSSVFALTP